MPPEPALNRQSQTIGRSVAGGALYRKTIKASFENVRTTISGASEALETLNLAKETLHSVQLVLAEALNNVVEHAYDASEEGDVTLILRHGRAGLLIEVRDGGKPMPNGRPPIGGSPTEESARTNLPEGGFGWYLIREIARDLIYDRRDGENFLIFRMTLEHTA